jgi:acetyl-CoA carboxylase biotin carboxyl carrier protein
LDRADASLGAPPDGERTDVAEVVEAEMVAAVLEVVVSAGDTVQPGDTLVLLESMKMEIPVLTEHGGRVTAVRVAVGDVVQTGDILAVID